MFSDKPKYSDNDLRHIASWIDDPQLLDAAAKLSSDLADQGQDPNNYYYLWSIVGVPADQWNKADGPPPTGVRSLGDVIPVIAIDLATLKKPVHTAAV